MQQSSLHELYASCTLCPRDCRVNRTVGARGFCGESDRMRLALATLHKGEEPPLTTGTGSGALFFTGCTLGCRDCQNCQLSRGELGAEVTADELAEIMLRLQEAGAANINLVTGTHFVPSIIEALRTARERGLTLPTVWNTSGFESPTTLELLDPWIDIYLTDVKSLSSALSVELTGREDYPALIRGAVPRMIEARELSYRDETLLRGVIVRHLVLPGTVDDSLAVIEWYGRRVGSRALFSLMTQFINPEGGSANEGISGAEYDQLLEALDAAGIEEGFLQEPAEESDWLPDFRRPNPFPSDFSTVLWHWREGFLSR